MQRYKKYSELVMSHAVNMRREAERPEMCGAILTWCAPRRVNETLADGGNDR